MDRIKYNDTPNGINYWFNKIKGEKEMNKCKVTVSFFKDIPAKNIKDFATISKAVYSKIEGTYVDVAVEKMNCKDCPNCKRVEWSERNYDYNEPQATYYFKYICKLLDKDCGSYEEPLEDCPL